MKEIAAKVFSKQNIMYLNICISLFCAYLLFPNYFELNIYPIQSSQYNWMSLDPSWTVTLNYLKMKGLVWGNDIAFTYGPLGQLCTRVGWGESKFLFLFFDLFMFVNWFLVFYLSLKQTKNLFITLFLVVSITLIFPDWIGIANSFVLLLFYMFWLRENIENNSKISYVFLISISVLMVFIKLNTGLIALPLFYCVLIYNRFLKKIPNKLFLGLFFIPFILIYILTILLNVSFFKYVFSALEIVSGYNEIMYLDNQIENSLNYVKVISCITLFAFIISLYLNKKLKIIEKLFLFGTSVLSFYLMYKQAFVRADVNHIKEFFLYYTLFVFVFSDFHTSVKNYLINGLTVFNVLIVFYFLNNNQSKTIVFKEKLLKNEYFIGFNNFNSTSGLHLEENYLKLPDSFLRKIGNETVDVYPWNTQMLLENKLNYKPRPVFQSYTTYTKELENLNFNHYNSPNAPQYVIYEFEAIDNRYPLFDESKLNLALKLNYQLIDKGIIDNKKILLLKKKSDFKQIKLEKVKEYAMYNNSPLIPQKDIYYEIELYNNIFGKYYSLVKNSPEIKLEIQIDKGAKLDYKTSKKLLESGMFSTFYIRNTDEFEIFMKNIDSDSIQKVKYYSFRLLNDKMFKEKIKITEYKILQ